MSEAAAAAVEQSLQIRPLQAAEIDAAVALWETAGLTRPWNDPHQDCRRAMGGPASEVLTAIVGGQLVGTVMVGHEGHRGWIYYLAVEPSLRGQQIGAQLVAAAEDWLREQNIPKLMLMVREGNDVVASFYDKLGYSRQQVMTFGKFL